MQEKKYLLGLISKLALVVSRPIITPIDTNVKLTTKEYNDHISSSTTDPPIPDPSIYQRLIDKLLCLTVTRHAPILSVQTLNQYLQHPNKSYMDATLRIVKYIKPQPG